MTYVKDEVPDHVLALLGTLMDGLRRDVVRIVDDPERDLPASLRGLRSSHLRVLSLTPADGMRVTDLAARVSMTKQALGEFANALEARGLIESLPDPSDGRVRVLRPTASGLEAVAAGAQVIAEVEARWRTRVGARDWDRLVALLRVASERGS